MKWRGDIPDSELGLKISHFRPDGMLWDFALEEHQTPICSRVLAEALENWLKSQEEQNANIF